MKTILFDHNRRHDYRRLDTVPTLEARMGTGGGNIPMILMEKQDESISEDNWSVMCEQPSWELYRSGCVQRYASSLQEER